MKQAILITAYKDFDNLVDIICFFDNSFNFYIHIDKKSKLSREQLSKIKTINNVKILSSKYKVNWGGLNHLKAILFLANKALKEHENHFFHLISGQDFPIQKLEVFKSIGLSILPKDYLEYFIFPLKSWDNKNGGFDRIEYYHLYDIINAKRYIKLLWRIVRIQKKIRYKRALALNYLIFMEVLHGGAFLGKH
ncbi:beta-1,6-N-acetylglucosaminyltransferase [Hyunsoonleella ulvae]|uniref:beta-1,6-N-acetylglucosaminyltransferase n=1 Tax=Hyunsoonleella ulvae TaxID=2799948 RepID=UPI00193A36DC|nr:beta-1,6-N-acetylglucosaminyltransferase [Hyunsoonleella ulvae]